jgi:Trehalose and maltose hydrolases (possible phosphorylases)
VGVAVAGWTLSFEGIDPARVGQREALCTLGNGYLATRGAAPEYAADGVHYPGTYVAGCYNRLRDVVGGRTVENESLVNVPNWLPVTFRGDDGPWLGQPGVDVLDHRLDLDFQRGVLTRTSRVRDAAGRVTAIRQRRFVHMRHVHVCGLQTTLTAEGWSGTMTVRSAIDPAVENVGVQRYRGLSSRHLTPLTGEPIGEDCVLCVSETNQSHVRIAEAVRTQVMRDDRPVSVARDVYRTADGVGHQLQVDIESGRPVTVDKLVTVYTSRDAAVSDPGLEAVQQLERLGAFDEVLDDHILAWRHLWQRFHISLSGKHARALTTVRLHLFHLLQTASRNTVEIDAGLPARGLHGEAYRGHVLWDELFAFPLLNLRTPLVSRAFLLYRYRRLPPARRAARDAGRSGAMYPWQSGSDGREETPIMHLNPLSGRWVPDHSHLQRHAGLAVAYNTWQFYQVTGDCNFLADYGAEMILEIARFFADLCIYDHRRNRYTIRGVMGPDEFHTGYPNAPDTGIDNNAYTNIMTVWVLLRALDTLDAVDSQRRTELIETHRLRATETRRWQDITRRMYLPMHGDGIISQFEGYEQLAELDWQSYRTRYGDIRRLDRILEAEGDTTNHYKASKQADVLMLFYLFSADELGELFDRLGYSLKSDMISKNIEYYLARTSHGSTLSAVVHAWVLARNHRAEAIHYALEALDSDVADIAGGTTAEGIHLAAMAGSVDLLQRCFAGVETRGDTLWLNPYWPQELGTLEFVIRYRGHRLTLQISGDAVRVSADAGPPPPIELRCRGQATTLAPGDVVTFPNPAAT